MAQRNAYILMERIEPRAAPAVLVKGGKLVSGEAVGELGVFSTYLRTRLGKVVINKAAGHLIRSKLRGVDEGGVAAGYACLSSPLAASTKS